MLDIWNHQRSYYGLPEITRDQLKEAAQQALTIIDTLDTNTINLLKSDNAKDMLQV